MKPAGLAGNWYFQHQRTAFKGA